MCVCVYCLYASVCCPTWRGDVVQAQNSWRCPWWMVRQYAPVPCLNPAQGCFQFAALKSHALESRLHLPVRTTWCDVTIQECAEQLNFQFESIWLNGDLSLAQFSGRSTIIHAKLFHMLVVSNSSRLYTLSKSIKQAGHTNPRQMIQKQSKYPEHLGPVFAWEPQKKLDQLDLSF
jgi:hypothetical protein